MDFFDRIGETITQVGNVAGQKAKDVSEFAKLTGELRSLEKKQQDLYIELGKKYFEEHGDSKEEAVEVLKEIAADVEHLKDQIAGLKGGDPCPNCGAVVPKGSKFCNSCGAKMSIFEDDEEETTEEE
ncbi:MAG: zinc-ribbon domain-containing protein [Lachnospiraceae bacterium]|nr:zinc-ribbon domain-containing protein [Lachnospiraceae bacterium]